MTTNRQTSERMARVRSIDTGPEMIVRRLLFRMGLRYRLHVSNLPGKPDIVFPSRKKLIFVNGCFWHQHPGCKRAAIPLTNRDYWEAHLAKNVARDRVSLEKLAVAGWDCLVVWECEVNKTALEERLRAFLEHP